MQIHRIPINNKPVRNHHGKDGDERGEFGYVVTSGELGVGDANVAQITSMSSNLCHRSRPTAEDGAQLNTREKRERK